MKDIDRFAPDSSIVNKPGSMVSMSGMAQENTDS